MILEKSRDSRGLGIFMNICGPEFLEELNPKVPIQATCRGQVKFFNLYKLTRGSLSRWSDSQIVILGIWLDVVIGMN